MSIAEKQQAPQGKVAIVTGASVGVGRRTAKTLARGGVKSVATAEGGLQGCGHYRLRLHAVCAYLRAADDDPQPRRTAVLTISNLLGGKARVCPAPTGNATMKACKDYVKRR